MAKFRVDYEKSRNFQVLLKANQKDFPNVESDIREAFASISQDLKAKHGDRVQVLLPEGYECYKHRQNSKDIKRGASYGWRIFSILDRSNNTLYPILIYAKPELASADTETIKDAIRDLFSSLGRCQNLGCGGRLSIVAAAAGMDATNNGKLKCGLCGATYYV